MLTLLTARNSMKLEPQECPLRFHSCSSYCIYDALIKEGHYQ